MDIMGVPIWKYVLVVLAIALLGTASIFLYHPIPAAFLDRCIQKWTGREPHGFLKGLMHLTLAGAAIGLCVLSGWLITQVLKWL